MLEAAWLVMNIGIGGAGREGKSRQSLVGEIMAGARFVRMGQRMAPWLAVSTLALALSACSAVYRNHGYVPTELELAQVQVGVDTQETVAQKLGRPSASALLNDGGWFYVQSRWESFGARAPQEIDRQVVAVSFAESGKVQNVERFGLEKGRVIVLSRRVTDTNVKGPSVMQQVMGSVGRLRAEDVID